MLLRASSEAIGATANLEATVGRGGSGGGVPHGLELVRFGETVSRGGDEVATAREALLEAVGPAGFVEAAAIVGIFNGLVRTADASGIPLDDGTRDDSADFRSSLGLNDYGGSANTNLDATGAGPPNRDVEKLFR